MNPTIDNDFATALRAALVDHVRASAGTKTRSRWHWRRILAGGAAVVLIGGGVAVAKGSLTTPPGADQVKDLGATVTVARSGTSTIELGVRPSGATDIELRLTCLSAGRYVFSDGASLVCSRKDAIGVNGVSTYALHLVPGQHSTTIRTDDPNARWTLTVTYSQHIPTPWATNDNGQTYGVMNDLGQEPDLLAAVASNGNQGYAYSHDINGPVPADPKQALEWMREDAGKTHTVPVYDSDGTTQIGSMSVPGVSHTASS